MLKGINKIISPDLLRVLAKMGHGDEIVISDGNFPGESVGRIVLRSDGTGVPELLSAILEIFPLDQYDNNVYLMDKTEQDRDLKVEIWDEYKKIVAEHTDKEPQFLERFAFYERARKAYAVVVTGESAIYANIILKKGVVK
ncbi:MAG: L-fucose mutarotase [Clostridia bacterium]|nr:L-fucose mutarotase [Clostridia bacterium]MBR3990908.1 L-fucose mutarotase [Clostridia bacterium]MBR6290164.1 L-fucose mutarotase [Clostridia bacterium]